MIIYIGWVKKIIAKFCLRELSEVLLRVDLYIAESPTNFIVEVSVIAESPSNFIVEVSVVAESTTNFIEGVSVIAESTTNFIGEVSVVAESTTNFIGGVSVVAESTSNFIVEVSVIAESTTNFIEVSNHHLNHILYIGGVCRREVFLFHLKAFFIHSSQSNNIRFMSIVYVVDYPHQVFVLGVGIEK